MGDGAADWAGEPVPVGVDEALNEERVLALQDAQNVTIGTDVGSTSDGFLRRCADRRPMVGLERGSVELVPYDDEWPRLYEQEAERLRAALDEDLLAVEHVGSTAIEGMAAKPVVDLLVVVEERGDADRWTGPLADLGYSYRPNDGVPDRLFFAMGPTDERTHYLSITERDSDTHREQVAFRDYLREHPDVAAEYRDLKRELAAEFADDRATYTERKSAFVQRILDEALGG